MSAQIEARNQSNVQRTLQVLALTAASLPGIGASAWAQADTAQPADPQTAPLVEKQAHHNRCVQVNSIADFIQRWTKTEQLYQQGNVGLKAEQLASIGTFLQAHPNWTVYLVQQASGQTYIDGNGNRYADVEAVIQGIKTGLGKKPEFKSLVESSNNALNGAVLMISFDADSAQRKVSYYSSDLQSNAGYGWKAWPNNLDKIAIERLKANRDVEGAVRNTVTFIDGKVREFLMPRSLEAASAATPSVTQPMPGEMPQNSPTTQQSDSISGKTAALIFGIPVGMVGLFGLGAWGVSRARTRASAQRYVQGMERISEAASENQSAIAIEALKISKIYEFPELANGETQSLLRRIADAKKEIAIIATGAQAIHQHGKKVLGRFHLGSEYVETIEALCDRGIRSRADAETPVWFREIPQRTSELQAQVEKDVATIFAAREQLPDAREELSAQLSEVQETIAGIPENLRTAFNLQSILEIPLHKLQEKFRAHERKIESDPVGLLKETKVLDDLAKELGQAASGIMGAAKALSDVVEKKSAFEATGQTSEWFVPFESEIAAKIRSVSDKDVQWDNAGFLGAVETAKEAVERGVACKARVGTVGESIRVFEQQLLSGAAEINALFGIALADPFAKSENNPKNNLEDARLELAKASEFLSSDLTVVEKMNAAALNSLANGNAALTELLKKAETIAADLNPSSGKLAEIKKRLDALQSFRAEINGKYTRHSYEKTANQGIDATALQISEAYATLRNQCDTEVRAGAIDQAHARLLEAREQLAAFDAAVTKLEKQKGTLPVLPQLNLRRAGEVSAKYAHTRTAVSSLDFSSETGEALGNISRAIDEIDAELSKPEVSPFAIADALDGIDVTIDSISARAQEDQKLAGMVRMKVGELKFVLEEKKGLFHEFRADARLAEALREKLEVLAIIEKDFPVLEERSRATHDSWSELNAAADERIAELRAIVEQFHTAKPAYAAIVRAEQSVDEAKKWAGRRQSIVSASVPSDNTMLGIWATFMVAQYVQATAAANSVAAATSAAMSQASHSTPSFHSSSHGSSSSSWATTNHGGGGSSSAASMPSMSIGASFGGGCGISSSGW